DLEAAARFDLARLAAHDLTRRAGERHDRARKTACEDHRRDERDEERARAREEDRDVELREDALVARDARCDTQAFDLGKIERATEHVVGRRGRLRLRIDGAELDAERAPDPREHRRDLARADEPDGDAAARSLAVHLHRELAART